MLNFLMEKSYHKLLRYHYIYPNVDKYNKELETFMKYYNKSSSKSIKKLVKVCDKIITNYFNKSINKLKDILVKENFDNEHNITSLLNYILYDIDCDIDNKEKLQSLKKRYQTDIMNEGLNSTKRRDDDYFALTLSCRLTNITEIIFSYYRGDWRTVEFSPFREVYDELNYKKQLAITFDDLIPINDDTKHLIFFLRVDEELEHNKFIVKLFSDRINHVLFV